jgi:energy-coupling factor transporter ATP-binding protein EcfA2
MGPFADNKNFNPFPGLRPYLSEESDWFFGRDVEMEEIYTKLLNNRFITLIGSSGCGKTSLINCGVIPLVKHHHIDGESEWRIISFRPGNDPIGNLAVAISEELTASGQITVDWKTIQSELFDNPDGIGATLRRFISNPQEKVLLVIDQFEELFRLAARGKKEIVAASVAKFVGLMVEVINQPAENIFSIISLRSDFIGESSRYHGLTQLINSSNYLVPELNPENYRRVIEGPIINAGARIDPQLVSTLLNDLGGRPEQLPVLQHVMKRTWSHWEMMDEPGRPVSVADYESVGRLSSAMSDHANEIYEGLSTSGKRICELMFKAITEKSQDNRGLRNPMSVSAIKYIAGCSGEELFEVIDKFRSSSASFIAPLPDIILADDSVIDLSQEILIKLWDRSRDWVEEEAASANMYLRLSEASAMYQQGKTGLWKLPDLQLAINWREQFKPTLAWAERYNPAFERAMVYLRTSEKKYIEEEANKLRLQKKRVRKIRIIASGLGIVALLSIGYTFFAIERSKEADRLAKYSETLMIQAVRDRERADSSSSVAIEQRDMADSSARLASQKAEEANVRVKIYESRRQKAEEEAAEALKLQNAALEQSDSAKRIVLLADENSRIATEQKNEALRLRMLSVGKTISVKSILLQDQKELQALLAFQAYLYNKNNNGPENDADIYAGLYNVARQNGSGQYKTFKGHSGDIRSIAFIPGQNDFFTSGSDGQVLKWSLNGSDRTFQVVYSGGDIINVLAVSPDANWLACGSENSSIRMIPLKGTDGTFEMNGHKGKIKSLVFSFDSKQIYSAALDGKVLKWEIAARTYTDVTTGLTQITSIDISYNGKYLAGVKSDGTAVVWDPGKISDNFSIPTTGKNIKVVRFNPDKNILALGDADGNVELWDISLRKKVSEVKAHKSGINDIRFNKKLNQMATAGDDKILKIYNIKDPSDLTDPPVTLTDSEGFIFVIEFSQDSRTIIAGTSGGGNNLVSRPSHLDYLVPDICNYVSRNMNQDEWNTYVGKDIAYERTCQGKSYNIKIEPIK